MAMGSGMNADDKMQNEYEQKLMDYYGTFGKDTAALYLPKTDMHMYGGIYEITSGVANKAIGTSDPNNLTYHTVRHIFNALFGFLAMLFTALLAKQIAGWRAGLLALVFIYLSPRFLGHSFMNPKDIPFAAGYIVSIYFLAQLLKELPKPGWKTILGVIVGIGIALGARVGGLLTIAYLGLFMGIDFLIRFGVNGLFNDWKQVLNYLKYGLIAVFGGVLFAILFWPFAMVDPIDNILHAYNELSKYKADIRLLFGGEMIFSQDIPNSYSIKWMFFTLPLFAIIGLIASVVFGYQILKKYRSMGILLCFFTFLFPIVFIIINDSTLYDGWRHLLFSYTPAVVLMVLAWEYLLETYKERKTFAYAIIAVLAITAVEPAIFIARNHHYPYVYFNPLIKGIKGAFGQFETDYWGISIKQGVEWLEKEGLISDDPENPTVIATNFYYPANKYIKGKFGDHAKTVYLRYRQRHDKEWDYALFCSRFVSGAHIRSGHWPPENTFHTIDANGVPLTVILKDEQKFASKGQKALEKQRFCVSFVFVSKRTGIASK